MNPDRVMIMLSGVDVLSELRPRLENIGLQAETLFDLSSACAPRLDRPCPHDGRIPCSCRLTVLRVGTPNWTCFVLVVHSHGGKTWLTIEDSQWVSSSGSQTTISLPGEPQPGPARQAAPQSTTDDMLDSLEQARRAMRAAAEGLPSDDPCLGVVARLTLARSHLRVAARSALRRDWERGRKILLTSADVGEREQASSRLLQVLRTVLLHPSWVR